MKVVIGIIIAALIAAIAAIILLFVMRSHDLVLCGDIPQRNGNQMYVQRVYTYDVDANSTLTQIIETMNRNSEGHISATQMTEILSEYQTVVYAPVFTYNLSQPTDNTYVLTGVIYNGIDEEGEAVETEYVYKDLALTLNVSGGQILAAQNIYPDQLEAADDDEEIPEFIERSKVIDPVLLSDTQAAFAFASCNAFRIVFTGKDEEPAELTLVYTFNVGAQDFLNFSGSKDNIMAVTIKGEFDDMGRLAPTIEMNRSILEIEVEE